jgi:hypothetical protein
LLEFLTASFANPVQVSPYEVALRLLTALALGACVSLSYRLTRRNPNVDFSFSVTLILLCVLIAMVTQVIGDSVARAFGLVGALSIVRFRTVVRDTQDTAYVIFAVIVGMAVGAQSLWVAVIGLGVMVLAEIGVTIVARRSAAPPPEYLLTLRADLDCDLDVIVRGALEESTSRLTLLSLGTGRQGGYLEGCYELCARRNISLPSIVKQLDTTPGVQSVQFALRNLDRD